MDVGYEAIAEAAVGVFTIIGIILVVSIAISMIGIVCTIIGLIRKFRFLYKLGLVIAGIGGIPCILTIGMLVINAIRYYLGI